LSITHHTRKRPSTGPRTTHGPQSPPWWVHWKHPQIVTREKRNEQNETPTSDRKPNKGKEKYHLKKTNLGPLRQGQRFDTSETKLCSSKEHTSPTKTRKPQQAPPAHMQAPLEPMKLPLDECMRTTSWNGAAASAQLSPVKPVTLVGQTDGQDFPAPRNYTSQTGAPHRSGRCHLGNYQSSKIARNHLETF
jgi:hypothetical protein